jgi:HEAT repeat protein
MTEIDPLPALIKQLKASDRKARAAAVEALGKLGDPRAVEALLPLARDKRWEVQSAVAQALGVICDVRALDTLKQMYNADTYKLIESEGNPHQYDAIVGEAAIGLARLYRQHGIPEIYELLTTRFQHHLKKYDDTSAACSLRALPYTGDPRVKPMLMLSAESSTYWLRYCGLQALGVLGDEDGLPILYKAVRSGSPLTLVWAAADALALFHHPEADEPLLIGLRRLEVEEFPKDQLWYQARAKIVRALGRVGTQAARFGLEQRLNMHDSQRVLGAIGLAYMGDNSVLETLINGLSSGDAWTQAAVAEALGEFGDPAVIPALEARLRDSGNAPVALEDAIEAALARLKG